MNLVMEFYVDEYRKHTRDEIFKLREMKRDIVLFSYNDNKLKLKFRNNYANWGDDYYVVDITGWKFFFTIKNKPTDSDDNAVYKNDDANMSEATDGEATITLEEDDTKDLLGNYLYSLKAKTEKGDFKTLCFGIITFQQELGTREGLTGE